MSEKEKQRKKAQILREIYAEIVEAKSYEESEGAYSLTINYHEN